MESKEGIPNGTQIGFKYGTRAGPGPIWARWAHMGPEVEDLRLGPIWDPYLNPIWVPSGSLLWIPLWVQFRDPFWTHGGSQVLPHTLIPGAASYPGPRCCLIPWSQVLPHTLVPSTASYPGPRHCLIPWSQVLPHTLVPGTASYSGPKT